MRALQVPSPPMTPQAGPVDTITGGVHGPGPLLEATSQTRLTRTKPAIAAMLVTAAILAAIAAQVTVATPAGRGVYWGTMVVGT